MNNQTLTNAQAVALDQMCPAGSLTQLGQKTKFALDAISGGYGTKWYLDPANGADSNDGLSASTAFKSLPVAYAALTANKNEILYVIGGASSLSLATAFTWSKSYTHMVGLTPGVAYGRVRIGHSANFTTMFTVTANGCVFQNIHWQMGRGSATNVNCVWIDETSNYLTFIGCHFDAPLNATEGAGAYRALVMGGTAATPIGARSCNFFGCTFGDWTASPSSATGSLVEFKGINAGTKFEDCDFIVNTSDASMVALIAAVDLGNLPPAYVLFSRCRFLALSTGVNVLATAPTTGKLVFADCKAVGVTNWSANSANVFSANSPALIADGGLGVVIT